MKLFRNKFSFFIYVCVILISINNSFCDLPIHCLKSEIIGKWKIEATKLYPIKNGHEMKCGHQEPSTENTSWNTKSNLPFDNIFEIEIKDDDSVIMINKNNSIIDINNSTDRKSVV